MSDGTVLVTGCAGFIGSTLLDALLASGRDVAGIDGFEPFYPRAAKERNLEAARRSSGFRFAEVDTRDRDALRAHVARVRPSIVVDLAARAGVRDSLANPWLYIDVNVTGLQNLLTATAEVGAAFVFASSSSVYAGSPDLPYREVGSILRPTSPYGATKIAGEALVQAHRALTGLPTRVARFFTVYGPRQRPDLAVRKFATALLDGTPIPLYDHGRATRDYTYVGDVVDGLVRLIDAEHAELTVNFGGGNPYSTSELVEHLERTFDRRATLDPMPKQPGDAADTAADVSLARSVLGWEPRTTLDVGLAKFRDWFLAERAAMADQAGSRPST